MKVSYHIPEQLQRWAKTPNKKVAITGATGWIGIVLAHLCTELGVDQRSGRLRLFGAATRSVRSNDRDFHIEALDNAGALGEGDWTFVHLAFLGKERTSDLSRDDFERINETILSQSQRLALSADKVTFVFSSSGAVYDDSRNLLGQSGEPYGYMKVLQEEKIKVWAEQNHLGLLTVRVFNIGGPCVNKQHLYALSDFIRQARDSQAIRIAADRPIFRSFVDVAELCQLMLIESSGLDGACKCYDTCGSEIIELEELAKRVISVLGLSGITVERPPLDVFSKPSWYVGDGRSYQTNLKRAGLGPIGLDEIIRRTAAFVS